MASDIQFGEFTRPIFTRFGSFSSLLPSSWARPFPVADQARPDVFGKASGLTEKAYGLVAAHDEALRMKWAVMNIQVHNSTGLFFTQRRQLANDLDTLA